MPDVPTNDYYTPPSGGGDWGIRKSVTCDAMIRWIRSENATVKVVNSLFYTLHLPSHCHFENLNVAPDINLPAQLNQHVHL